MDGLLVIDKPAGPTSHDVVARVRRILRERRVGHTGTLDPIATGVLPLVVGRATRLARFLSSSDKSYEAVMTLGYATDTGDATGAPIARAGDKSLHLDERTGPLPSRAAIEHALEEFRGAFLQQPPVYSAKKVGGRRSHRLARTTRATESGSDPSVPLRPVQVTTYRLDVIDVDHNRVTLHVDCSAGFYVRALAHDLGERLGVGAHLAALRRTRSGDYILDDAIALDTAERDPQGVTERLIPLANMLSGLPAVVLTPGGVRLACHGREVGPGDIVRSADVGLRSGARSESALRTPRSDLAPSPLVRLVDPAGDLIGIARPGATSGLLHPFVVLG